MRIDGSCGEFERVREDVGEFGEVRLLDFFLQSLDVAFYPLDGGLESL